MGVDDDEREGKDEGDLDRVEVGGTVCISGDVGVVDDTSDGSLDEIALGLLEGKLEAATVGLIDG